MALDWGVGLLFLFYQRSYWSSRNFPKTIIYTAGL